MTKRGYWNQEQEQSGKGTVAQSSGDSEVQSRKRYLPRVDPEILSGEHPNDFDRWLDGQRTEARGQRSDVGECVGVCE